MVRRGESWGGPAPGPPDREVRGDDRALAGWAVHSPGALVWFRPDSSSDLARSVGLPRGDGGDSPPGATAVPMDVLRLPDGDVAVNMVVVGPAPDRVGRFTRKAALRVECDGEPWFEGTATTFVCAIGQWRGRDDVVPRGHPGDGRAEVQVYRLRPAERRAMRARLPRGDHVPHPRILQRSVRTVALEADRPLAYEVDGAARAPVDRLLLEVVPGAYRLLV